MARLALSIGGMVLGNMLLPGIGSAIGGAVGAYVGGIIDQQLFGSGTPDQTVYGARLQDLRAQSSSYGSVIPALYGKGRLASNVIWMRGFHEETRTTTETVGGGGGKGGGGGGGGSTRTTVEYHYYCDVAIGLCQGPIASVPRTFADGNALDPAHVGDMRIYPGSQTQGADPLIQAVEGAANTPAYRGLAYVVLERLHITPYGNRLPQLSFEVVT
ncbi:hypothetical protein [Blastochloris viridis]|uniref:Gene transfer agent host specificity protein n=1 Tax=Blastochloris viridis TaxID=1079 RepID=A0A0H5BQL7_BLAVI|nr:hypothetical protein [Blastochloris viridis]ALK08969.1 hypothetical protein BVIR_1180 [Blastochloris viridis]BAS01169.1 gene transfer agent host specificity protein [Blastochloris viridis]CUU41630.1 hypothetical protein BVIRIDIS_06230 [Blastochloris viridis]